MVAYLRPGIVATVNLLVLSVALGGKPPQPAHEKAADIELFAPDKLDWKAGPPSLPKGAMMAVLEGDPTKEGPFVFRVKVPDGYRVPPHTHPKTERVTVISGTFNIGMGDKFDEQATRVMAAGAYGYWPAGMKHFVWAKAETVLQFHGIGPWSIQYVNPDDDPRKKKDNTAPAEKPRLKSGLQVGENVPGPFNSLVANSEDPKLVGLKMDFFEYCGGNPVVSVFSRDLTEPLTSLIERLNTKVPERKSAKLRAIVVILSDDDALEKPLKNFAAREGIKNVSLAIMEPAGPKHYKLRQEAEVTVLLYKNRKVVVNHAFRKNELTEKSSKRILTDLSRIAPDHGATQE